MDNTSIMYDTAFISVCSPERLSQFKVLADSIKKHCPEVDLLLYYGGPVPETFTGFDITPWLNQTPYTNNWYRYCSVRAKAVLDAFDRGYERVVLLGADTELFAYPHELLMRYNSPEPDMFVTMYTDSPYQGDQGPYPNDYHTFEVGQIQADCVAFSNNEQCRKFLAWLDSKPMVINDRGRDKIMLDQGWMSLCFSFLKNVHIIRHSGYNVGNYNMFQREMRKHGETWVLRKDQPLVLFHYAGLEKNNEHLVSKHQNRYRATGDILDFLKDYTRRTA